jgi:hypothetical protein
MRPWGSCSAEGQGSHILHEDGKEREAVTHGSQQPDATRPCSSRSARITRRQIFPPSTRPTSSAPEDRYRRCRYSSTLVTWFGIHSSSRHTDLDRKPA